MSHIQKHILHIDMDAFFASIEQRDEPSYRGRALIVGADPLQGKGRGVVSACSYEARQFGIHSAMPISIAYNKCPQGIFLPVNMQKYIKVSKEMFAIFKRFTPIVEQISIDEAFLDISGSYHLFGSPLDTALSAKKTIKKELDLIASVGLAPNKFLAKIASDLKKPDALVVVDKANIPAFLEPLPVQRMWGIGTKTLAILKGLNIHTIGDLRQLSLEQLLKIFGKQGLRFYHLSRGIDDRPVKAVSDQAKSISNEFTFEKDCSDPETINNILLKLSEKVSYRLRKQNLKGRTISIKIRLANFKTFSRSITIAISSNFSDTIFKHCRQLYNNFSRHHESIRLLGVKVSNFCSGELNLVDETKNEDLHEALDKLKDKFGDEIIGRGSNLKKKGL